MCTQYRERAEKYNVSSDHLGGACFPCPKVLRFGEFGGLHSVGTISITSPCLPSGRSFENREIDLFMPALPLSPH
jgi:hypothetical protein